MSDPKRVETSEVVEAKPIMELDEVHAAVVVHNVETLTRLFDKGLKPEVDYTQTLFGGNGKKVMLDAGAQKVRSFYRAYPETHILEHIEDRTPGRERIKYVVRADITHISGVRIGSGVGSCTTDETKYLYRWLTASKLRGMGYTKEQIAALPSQERRARRGGRFTVYRVRNPDILDLDNTILKMASKRAEVDATLSLPGVAGVFTQDIEQYPEALGLDDEPKKVEADSRVVEPEPDADEEHVKAALEENGVNVDGLRFYSYGKQVRVEFEEEPTQDRFNEINDVLHGTMGAKWVHAVKRWEVPGATP